MPEVQDCIDYIERLNGGWRPGRDGFGFLIWMGSGGVWEPMSEAEAGVWHVLNDRWAERVHAPSSHHVGCDCKTCWPPYATCPTGEHLDGCGPADHIGFTVQR